MSSEKILVKERCEVAADLVAAVELKVEGD